MTEQEKREYQTVILAALLHDIGKFYQRTLGEKRGNHQQLGDECFEQYFAEKLSIIFTQNEIKIIRSAINNHHRDEKFITLADGISAGMERIKLDDEETGDPSKEKLLSVFEEVSLFHSNGKKVNEYTHYLKPLSFKKEELFPDKIFDKDIKEEYLKLWEGFVAEVEKISALNPHSYLNVLYAILQKYTWCIPSATYKDEPDISLFDHAKTTAAIAGCLYYNKKMGEQIDKDFLLIAGDISGIQNFIYKITKSQGTGGISKRLRGRSFYLLLLQDVIAKYIIKKVGLFTANILFSGGGIFQLLLPNTEESRQIIEEVRKDVNKWLFEEHGGELGLILERVETNREGLADYGSLLIKLDEKLSLAKKRKFLTSFNDDSFWCEKPEKGIKICKVCNINRIFDDKKPCLLCEEHEKIGSELPQLNYLIFATEELQISGLPVSFDKFGVVYLVQEKNVKEDWLKSDKILDIQRINDLSGIKTGFRFIGNTAPVAKETIDLGINKAEIEEDRIIRENKVLSFEAIADASIGDKRLGILKMDVDNLGLIFAIGLEGKRKSISRISTISRSMDIFFVGYINKICDDIFNNWFNESDWEHKAKVNQIFYMVYSGGDDLLIVGPWSEIPKLAKAIRDEFKEYTCNNPDINISAGVFFCKPKYLISLAAKGSGEQLETSKNKGKKRITLFGDTVEWVACLDELLSFGEELYQDIAITQKLPRGFVHGLLRKHKQYNGGEDYRFIPAIIYQLARNVKDDRLREELRIKLITDKNGYFKHIKIPASYALLKSRKEG